MSGEASGVGIVSKDETGKIGEKVSFSFIYYAGYEKFDKIKNFKL